MMDAFIHETAIIDTGSEIGSGSKIWAFSHISSGASIGKNCIIGEGVHVGPNVIIGDNCKIQNHSILYEGVQLGDEVFIGPNVVTTNDFKPRVSGDWKESNRFRKTYFENGCSIGANSTIICGVKIGKNSLIGAGSVVCKDVMDHSLTMGNPAKHTSYITE